MSIPLVTRSATPAELSKLRLFMSTYTDGSGNEKNPDGSTRPGWRELERIIAELLGGHAPEGKSIFDIVIRPDGPGSTAYGVSVKSKGFSQSGFNNIVEGHGRVYMELCNSPAKLWDPLKTMGIDESLFSAQQHPQEIGESVLKTVHNWYKNCNILNIDLQKSVHVSISYLKHASIMPVYQVHTYPLGFPQGIEWRYKSERCLTGYDPIAPTEPLFDWYGLSGGQLKYYPKASNALYSTEPFDLISRNKMTIEEKAKGSWPDHFCWQE